MAWYWIVAIFIGSFAVLCFVAAFTLAWRSRWRG